MQKSLYPISQYLNQLIVQVPTQDVPLQLLEKIFDLENQLKLRGYCNLRID